MAETYTCLCCGKEADGDRDFIFGQRPGTGCCWKCILGNPGCETCVAEGLPGDVAVRHISGDGAVFRPDM